MEIESTGSGICVEGFSAAGVREKYGLALIKADAPCAAAAVYTRNSVKAAPLQVTSENVGNGVIQAIIANSGNANACVREGLSDAREMCRIGAEVLGVDPSMVAVASTGIIGRRIDIERIRSLAAKAAAGISCSPGAGTDAAKAIMTTDTVPKQYSFSYKGVEIGGICKGSGMIAPNMATMLCFLTTNADLDAGTLQECLQKSVADSFNMLVVDGDMSTNDTVLLLASGKVKCRVEDFQRLLDHITREFTKLMALDGEGATKFLEVELRGARDEETARAGVHAVITSPLVKTAMNGENPNWGRIVAALGKVMDVDFEKVDLWFESGGVKGVLVEKGVLRGLEDAGKVLKNRDIRVVIDMNSGDGKAMGWGCDLSKEYVRINAEYN